MSRVFYFSGGEFGDFRVEQCIAVRGEPLPKVPRLSVTQQPPTCAPLFTLVGVVSNERYVTAEEKLDLVAKQVPLGRTHAVLGAFIALKKNAMWWALSQDQRRKVFEADSKHIALGMRALPAISRRLHHCRDLATPGPFDFLTWFDFAPSDAPVFDELLGELRASEEWNYVEREFELRVVREPPPDDVG